MKKLLLSLFIGAFCAGGVIAQSTAFTYQGKLLDGASPASANYDFEFRLYDALTGGNQLPVGSGITLTKSAVPVANGIFSVTLDFGAQFTGAARFLDIMSKKSSDSTFTPLAPRQPITSAPYSIRSLSALTADAAPAGTLTGNTLNNTVANSNLTSVGVLSGLTVTGPILANGGIDTPPGGTGNLLLGAVRATIVTVTPPLRVGLFTADPTGTNGLIYYNTTSNKFRCFQGGFWLDCISTQVFAALSDPLLTTGNATLQEQVKQQSSEIDALKKLLCTHNKGAEICKQEGVK